MTEGIWIALIGAVQVLSLGLLGKIAGDSSRTKKQVENSHVDDKGEPYNLRDNIDQNQVELLSAVGRVEEDVKGMKKDIGRLDDRDLAHGAHHERVDSKLDSLDTKLDDHLLKTATNVARIAKLEGKQS